MGIGFTSRDSDGDWPAASSGMRGAPGIAAGIEHAPEPQGWKRRPLRGYRRDLLTTARGANGEGAEIRDFGFADWAEGVPRRPAPAFRP